MKRETSGGGGWRVCFSVNSSYKQPERLYLLDGNLSEDEELVFGGLRKSGAPFKGLAFAWTLLLDRIPTRVNLAIQGVLNADASKSCVFCGRMEETILHLFLHCEVVAKVWQKIMRWLQLKVTTPHNLLVPFLCWTNEARNKKTKNGFRLIWNASI